MRFYAKAMTGFIIATAISTALLVLSVAIAVYIAKLPYRGSRLATPSRVLAVGVFFSGWALYFPYYFYCLLHYLYVVYAKLQTQLPH